MSTTAEQDFKAFLQSKGKEHLYRKAWDIVRWAAFDDNPAQSLANNFSPEAIAQVIPIMTKYVNQVEQEIEADNRIDTALYEARSTFDDEVFDEIDAYARVYSDRIEFVALVTGYGPKLPKVTGRKYIGDRGDMRWRFPLSALQQLRAVADIVFDADGNRV